MNLALLTIEVAKETEYGDIYKINDLAFGKANESTLIKQLKSTDRFIPELSLIAKYKGINVGHLLLTRLSIGEHHNFLALAPMAVHPEFQMEGVGGALIKAAIEKARKLDFDGIVVLGHKDYYPKFGFKPALDYDIHCPFDVASPYFMVLPLKSIDHVSGTVVYAPPFMEV